MLLAETIRTSQADFSRCDEKAWLLGDEQNLDDRVDKTDASIVGKVDRALWNNDVLRSTDYSEIDIDVKDRMVFLSGHVINATNQRRAEEAARAVPGVLVVKSYLVPDDSLLREVAGALGKIEHVYGVKFFVGVRNGVVSLHGEAGSATVRSLAEKCAATIPGVRGVINSVRAPGFGSKAEDQRFFQPVIGEQIYFRDGLSGKVQSVIIHPNNRRVVAMVVRGQFANTHGDPRYLEYGEYQAPEQLLVIPMSAIRYLTKQSGFLHIASTEAAQYRDFDPTDFTAPRNDWTPPYPYCRDDILFPVEAVAQMNHLESELAGLPALFSLIQPRMIQSLVLE